MPFGGADSDGPKEARITWVQGRTNPFAAARGDNMRCGFSSKSFDHLFTFTAGVHGY